MRVLGGTFFGALIGAIAGLPVSYVVCICRTTACQDYVGYGNGFDEAVIGPTVIVCTIIGAIIGLIWASTVILNEMEERRASEEARRQEEEKKRKAEEANIARINRERQKGEARAREAERTAKCRNNANTLKNNVDNVVKRCSEQTEKIITFEIPPFQDTKEGYVSVLHIAVTTNTMAIPRKG